jgi:predicted ATP-grasp superfamily ATP-dependent carboligase
MDKENIMGWPDNDSNAPVGAIVVGGDYMGLGIARSLGRRNIPVCVIDDERSISRFSRYVTHSVLVPNLRDEKQAVEAMLDTGRRLNLKGWVLYPTRDELVAAFSRYRSLLTPFFRVPTPEWDSIQWVWDKRNTYHMAAELDIPTPRTWYPREISDLDQIDIEPPYVIKPAIKEHFFYEMKVKAWRANSRPELRQYFQRANAQVAPGEVMIQELIPGGGSQQLSYCALFKEGRAVGSMVVRRSRQHPLEFGKASTFVETIQLPILEELSERFLKNINYYGLVELEYKLDPRNGEYKLLDVNGRNWGYHSIGHAAGVDFSSLLFADQTNQAVQPCRAEPGISWIRLITDMPTNASVIAKGGKGLWAYLESLWKFDVESVFSWEDPAPGLAELALLPYSRLRRAF